MVEALGGVAEHDAGSPLPMAFLDLNAALLSDRHAVVDFVENNLETVVSLLCFGVAHDQLGETEVELIVQLLVCFVRCSRESMLS